MSKFFYQDVMREQKEINEGRRKCHDCGRPGNGNYHCAKCRAKLRGISTDWQTRTSARTDGDYIFS